MQCFNQLDRLFLHNRDLLAPDAHVDDLSAVVDGIDNRLGQVGCPGVAEAVESLEHHDLSVRIDTGDADVVVLRRRNDPGYERAMSVVIPGPIVACNEVPSDDVVDVSVAVIILTVVRRFSRISPQIRPTEIQMVPIKAKRCQAPGY